MPSTELGLGAKTEWDKGAPLRWQSRLSGLQCVTKSQQFYSWKSFTSVPCSSYPMWLTRAPSTPAWLQADRSCYISFTPAQSQKTPIFPKHTFNFAALYKILQRLPLLPIGCLQTFQYVKWRHSPAHTVVTLIYWERGEGTRKEREKGGGMEGEGEERECEHLPPNPTQSPSFLHFRLYMCLSLQTLISVYLSTLRGRITSSVRPWRPKGFPLPGQPAWNPQLWQRPINPSL